MRGFEAGGIGPRECAANSCGISNNDALGGEHFAVARFEAEFPLGLPDEYGFSGGLFYDVGNLWSLQKLPITFFTKMELGASNRCFLVLENANRTFKI